MIDGITILNSIPVYASHFHWLFYAIPILCLIIGIIIAYFTDFGEAIMICFLIGLVIIAAGDFEYTDKNNLLYTKYEVSISDEVKLKEFYNKYEIIEKRNEIYLIKEKENDN